MIFECLFNTKNPTKPTSVGKIPSDVQFVKRLILKLLAFIYGHGILILMNIPNWVLVVIEASYVTRR